MMTKTEKLPKLAINFDERRCAYHLHIDDESYLATAFGDDSNGTTYIADGVPVWHGKDAVCADVELRSVDLATKLPLEVFQDAWVKAHCQAAHEDHLMNGGRELMTFTFPWPGKAMSPNWTGHWAKKSAAKKAYRSACKAVVDGTQTSAASMPPDAALGVLMRFYPPTKRARDWDNLMASMKSGLDGLADGLGVNDNLFRPRMEVMTELKNCVEIEIEVI